MHYSLPWDVLISEAFVFCITGNLYVSFASHPFEVEKATFKLWTKAVVDGDLRVINVTLHFPILVLAIINCEGTVTVD